MIDEDYEEWKFSKADKWYIIKWALIIGLGILGLFIGVFELLKRLLP